MDWSQVTALTIPEGNVAQVAVGDIVLWKKSSSLLPIGYTQLDYIIGGNGAWLDTGIMPSNDMVFETKIDLDVSKIGDDYFSSCRQNTSNTRYYLLNLNRIQNYGFVCSNSTWANMAFINTSQVTAPYEIQSHIEATKVTIGVNNIESTANTVLSTLPTASLPLFAGKTNIASGNPTINITPYPVKCYYARYINNGVLVRNFIPAMRNSDAEIGMYDTVSNTFFTNAGTGKFIAGTVILPSDYTLLDYVQSTGQQWFSTGKVLDQTKNYSVEVSFSELQNVNESFFGSITVDTNARTFCTYNGNMYCGLGTNRLNYGNKINITGSFILRGDWNGSNNNLDVYVNNVKASSGIQNGNFTNIELYFLTMNNGSGMTPASCKTHSFKITEDGEIIRHYIPCKRNSDNKAGMYDLITKEFKSSMTTTDFIAGTEV